MMEPWQGRAVLFKFGKREHLEEFRRDGLLYMSSEKYFTDLEHDSVRSDRFEGSDQIHQPSEVKQVTIADGHSDKKIVLLPKDLAGPLIVGFGKRSMRNLFCMFAVTKPVDGAFVDERNFGFGDSFIVFLSTQRFIDQVSVAAEGAGVCFNCGFVEYFDVDTYSGETGLFCKPSTLKYQNEFRITIHPGDNQPIRLCVGSLVDITAPVFELANINRLVEFGPDSARRVGLVS